jgi:GNAT superfamily N-acetyltransferase
MAPASKRPAAPKPPPDPTKLQRQAAGRYVSGDGRFTVEQSSNGWMVEDAEQTNELGLALVRGPFSTLDDARAAMDAARQGPAPISYVADRIAAIPKSKAPTARGRAPSARPPKPEPPPIAIREYRSGDGEPLRALWASVGFRSLGDDDAGLRAFAQRNQGSFLVALRGTAVVGSAMGAWDGRRGWIYHVATAAEERRSGLATRLVRQVEDRLSALGCRKVNVIVRDENDDGTAFWEALGYTMAPARQFGRELPG